MKYGIIFWGNSPDAKKIFLLQKRFVRIMMGMKQIHVGQFYKMENSPLES
jgi:hypothetical protein